MAPRTGYALLLGALLLSSCASPVTQPPGDLRVIVRFGASTDPVDPALLRRLSDAARSEVRVSARITDTESAYWLRCTERDPFCEDMMLRLLAVPPVEEVMPDRYRYPSEPTR
ncbi:MAG: hypothetical protein KDH15_22070 [Rhodocyclaceae bacterium]|nr:hypothetical protein [Rhodocyclaceae bacterium]